MTGRCHGRLDTLLLLGLCQPPSEAMQASISLSNVESVQGHRQNDAVRMGSMNSPHGFSDTQHRDVRLSDDRIAAAVGTQMPARRHVPDD